MFEPVSRNSLMSSQSSLAITPTNQPLRTTTPQALPPRGSSDAPSRPAPYNPHSSAVSLAHRRGTGRLQKQPSVAGDPKADMVIDGRDVNAEYMQFNVKVQIAQVAAAIPQSFGQSAQAAADGGNGLMGINRG